jgi:hypothetical protein
MKETEIEAKILFSYIDVSKLLCEACYHNIPDVWECDVINHKLNGASIPCLAQAWRRNSKVHEIAFGTKAQEP